MDKQRLTGYLEQLDQALHTSADLYIYGSAAFILLDEPDRTSLDIDVAGPYSKVDMGDLRKAAASIGLPINPDNDYQGDHIEWIGPLRLCLQPPDETTGLPLWQGSKLTVRTGSVAALIASKLIRYDFIDRSDVQFLFIQHPLPFKAVASAVDRLPFPFATDSVLRENLGNLKADMALWKNPS